MAPEAGSTPYRATAFADSKPELAEPGPTPERLAHLKEHGFVIITDFVDNPWIPILREAGRRVTDACAPENGYTKLDLSKGYVHRTDTDDPWAIRGIVHPAFGEPDFAEFLGSEDFVTFVDTWCGGLKREDFVLGNVLLWCNLEEGEQPELASKRSLVGHWRTQRLSGQTRRGTGGLLRRGRESAMGGNT